MDRLSPLAAAFLLAEDEDRNASMAIASVAVLAGEPPGRDEFAALVGRIMSQRMDREHPLWEMWVVDGPTRDPYVRSSRPAAAGRARAAQRAEDLQAGAGVMSLAQQGFYAPAAWAIRMAAHLPHRGITTVTTNVPGPRRK